MQAEAEVEAIRSAAVHDGEQVVAKARREAQHLVAEALGVREKLLGDLARRRRAAREQVERLNAARERLLAAYAVVLRTADEATAELKVALPAARVAADQAARRVLEEPEPSAGGHRGRDVHRPHGRAGRRRHRRRASRSTSPPWPSSSTSTPPTTSTCPTPCPG